MARSARIVQAGVAGRDGAVAVGHADDGLVEIAVAEADRAQHGAVGSALDALGDQSASFFVDAHWVPLLEAVTRNPCGAIWQNMPP